MLGRVGKYYIGDMECCAGNDEDCFQEALGIMKVQMDEMDACPNCTESKACDKHRNMFDEELK